MLTRLRVKITDLTRVAEHRYYDDMLSLRAMGLTYSTLVSLIPFLAVTFSVLKAFGVQNVIEPFVVRALAPLGPESVEVTRRVVTFVDNIRVGALGAIGLAGLFYTVFTLVSNVEDSLNRIWRVDQGRSWGHKFSDYFSVVLVGPVLVFSAFALTAGAQNSWIVQRLTEIRYLGLLFMLLTQVMPFILLCLAFTILYRLVPNTEVRLRSALFGGAIAAILWQAMGTGFAAFVATSARYEAIYSSFAILVLFLIWVYVGWLVVLIGGEAAYFHQHRYAYIQEISTSGRDFSSLERVTLLALQEIARRYLLGQPPYKVKELASSLGVPFTILKDPIDRCVRHGMLVRCAEPQGITLARPPDEIAVIDVLNLLRRSSEEPNSASEAAPTKDPISDLLMRRDRSANKALEGLSLRSIVLQRPRAVSGPMASVSRLS